MTNATFSHSIHVTGPGNINITKSGAGVLTLSGANIYGGTTTISAGSLRAGSATGLSSNSAFVVNSTLDLNGFSSTIGSLSGNGSGVVTNNGGAAATLTAGGDDSSTVFAGTILDGASATGLTKIGTGTLTLSGSNNYHGTTTVSAGTLQAGSATGLSSNSAFVVNSTLDLNGFNSTIGSLSGTGSGVVTNNGGAAATLTAGGDNSSTVFAGTILDGASATGLTKTGTGTLTLSGSNDYHGTTTISAGSLRAGSATGLSSNSAFVVNSTLDLNGFNSTIGSLSGTGSGVVTNNGGAAATLTAGGDNSSTMFAGTILDGASATGLTKTGTGTLTLSGSNSYHGTTTISAGTLQAGSATGLSSNSAFVVNSTLDLNGFNSTIGSLSGTGSGVVTNNGGAAATLTAGGDNSSTMFAGTILDGASATGLTKTGTGTLTLSGANTYTGGTTINSGTLQLGTAGSMGSILGAVTVGGSGTFAVTNADTSGITSIANAGLTNFYGSSTAGSAAITTNTGGTTAFFGSSTGGDARFITNAGGTFDMSNLTAFGMTAGSIEGGGSYNLGARELTVGSNNLSTEVSGVISGAGGSLVKTGTGTLTLSGVNTYTGGTTINSGTLQLGTAGSMGSILGAVTVGGSGTFAVTNADTSGITSIANAGFTNFYGSSAAGSAAITNNATLRFFDTSTAGSAAITTNAGGATAFFGSSTGGDARFITKVGGTFDMSNLTASGMTAGSIEGGGSYNLGAKELTVGSNNLSTEVSGVISGSGRLVKTGAGKLLLSGNGSAFTGTTTVSGGILSVTGVLGGVIDVVSGGKLGGTGGMGGSITVSAGGTFAPGNSIGTLNVAGNVTFNAGSIYEVEINAAGQSDKIVASGMATINGGTVQVLAGAGKYAPSTQYTILTANGGRSGNFAGVTSNLAFLDPSLGYDTDNVYLTMTRNDTSFASAGVTPNQIATGGGVESRGGGNAIYDAVLSLSAEQARSAFDQLSGEIHASAKTAMIEDSRFVRSAVNDRIRAAFAGVGASGGDVVTYENGAPRAVAPTTDGLAVWGQSFGSWGNWNGDGNAARLNRSIGGFFIGADASVFDTWRFGAVAGYSRSSFDVKDRRSSGSSDNYHVGLYGGTTWGDLAFRTGAAYTRHDIATSRSVSFPGFGDSLKGNYNAGTAQVFGELGYRMQAGNVAFEPFANLAYVNLRTDGFTETGGAAALTSAGEMIDATFSTLGLRSSTTLDLNGATVTAEGMLGWRHAYGDVAPLSTMSFAGGGNAFTIAGVPVARDAAVVEAGLGYAITSNATLGATYGGQFGDGVADQSFKASFNVKF